MWRSKLLIFKSLTMNKVLFICILLTGCFSIQAQSIKPADVPAAVTSVFKNNYPYATDAKWENEDGMYEVSFKNANKDISVLYSYKGELAMIETPCEVSALPANIMAYLTKNVVGAKITEASKLVDAQEIVSYEVEVNNTDYLFTANGQFILTRADDDDDNN